MRQGSPDQPTSCTSFRPGRTRSWALERSLSDGPDMRLTFTCSLREVGPPVRSCSLSVPMPAPMSRSFTDALSSPPSFRRSASASRISVTARHCRASVSRAVVNWAAGAVRRFSSPTRPAQPRRVVRATPVCAEVRLAFPLFAWSTASVWAISSSLYCRYTIVPRVYTHWYFRTALSGTSEGLRTAGSSLSFGVRVLAGVSTASRRAGMLGKRTGPS